VSNHHVQTAVSLPPMHSRRASTSASYAPVSLDKFDDDVILISGPVARHQLQPHATITAPSLAASDELSDKDNDNSNELSLCTPNQTSVRNWFRNVRGSYPHFKKWLKNQDNLDAYQNELYAGWNIAHIAASSTDTENLDLIKEKSFLMLFAHTRCATNEDRIDAITSRKKKKSSPDPLCVLSLRYDGNQSILGIALSYTQHDDTLSWVVSFLYDYACSYLFEMSMDLLNDRLPRSKHTFYQMIAEKVRLLSTERAPMIKCRELIERHMSLDETKELYVPPRLEIHRERAFFFLLDVWYEPTSVIYRHLNLRTHDQDDFIDACNFAGLNLVFLCALGQDDKLLQEVLFKNIHGSY
jgi:hypothetical protein